MLLRGDRRHVDRAAAQHREPAADRGAERVERGLRRARVRAAGDETDEGGRLRAERAAQPVHEAAVGVRAQRLAVERAQRRPGVEPGGDGVGRPVDLGPDVVTPRVVPRPCAG